MKPFLTFEAEILEVIDALGVHELHEHSGRPSVGVAEVTLQGDVIVLDGPAAEAVLV